MYFMKKKNIPYGMFVENGKFGAIQRKYFQRLENYDIAPDDRFNPGRLVRNADPTKSKVKQDNVYLFVNIPEGNSFGVGKGWVWMRVRKDIDLMKIFKVQPFIFVFRETPIRDYSGTPQTAETSKKAAHMNYYDALDLEEGEYYDDEYQELLSEERELDRLLRVYGDDSDDDDVDDDYSGSNMIKTKGTGAAQMAHREYNDALDFEEDDEFESYDDEDDDLDYDGLDLEEDELYDDEDDDLYEVYQELLSEERAIDQLLRAYEDVSDESDDDDELY